MPLYYFDILKNGDVAVDHQGHELANARHAHKEAVRALVEMGAEEIPKDGHLDLAVSVADERHRVLFKTSLSFEPGEAPEDLEDTIRPTSAAAKEVSK